MRWPRDRDEQRGFYGLVCEGDCDLKEITCVLYLLEVSYNSPQKIHLIGGRTTIVAQHMMARQQKSVLSEQKKG